MRAFWCLVVFVMVVFVGDRSLAFVASRVIRHSHNQFVKMYEGAYPADILFLGNSRVDRNIDVHGVSERTGKVCLNLGLGGNHVLISEALLKDYVDRYGNPQLVVAELSHSTVMPDSMGEMAIFSYCSSNMFQLQRSIDPTYAAFESLFKSLRFNSQTFWRLSAEVLTEPAPRLLNNRIPAAIINEWNVGKVVTFPRIEKNMAALDRLCRFADSRGIEIRLVIAPYWKPFRMGISNFESWKADLVKAAGSHRVYDYSEEFFDEPDYFNDEMHLNASGAKQFTRKLFEDRVLW